MPGITVVRKHQQPSYVPASGVTITGGQVVEGRTGSRIGPAAAGSLVHLGVALGDAISPEAVVTTPTVVGGRNVLNAAILPTIVAVAGPGEEVPVTYAADAAFGQALICAANGTVTPAGAAPDARTIVGKCTQQGGVVVATKAVGLMRIA